MKRGSYPKRARFSVGEEMVSCADISCAIVCIAGTGIVAAIGASSESVGVLVIMGIGLIVMDGDLDLEELRSGESLLLLELPVGDR